MSYLLNRLREPGTMRSLAVCLFGLLGIAPDDPRVEAAIQVAILALGVYSALMPEPTVKVLGQTAAKAEEATQAAQRAAALTARTAEAANATLTTMKDVAGAVLGPRR